MQNNFFCLGGREADGFVEVGHKISYYCFSKNLYVI